MGSKELQVTSKQSQVAYIAERFNLSETVEHLHKMMKEVTKKDITPSTVNAACNCVQQLNNTIDTTIKAARFLSEHDEKM